MDSTPDAHPSDFEMLFGHKEGTVCSRSSTNETASDLPGPGRLLGNLYSYLGRHLETAIGKTAERMGYGPHVVAERIRRRTSLIRTYEDGLHHFETCIRRNKRCSYCELLVKENRTRAPTIHSKKKKVVKDCKKLLKYVNPAVQSTHMQAMDAIFDLSTEDFEVRDVLKLLGATQTIWDSIKSYKAFRYSEYDDLLLASSRKALVCFEDSEITLLLRDWIQISRSSYYHPGGPELEEKLAPYIYDPRIGFLVIRVFLRLLREHVRSFDNILRHMVSAIDKTPLFFEWEECDRVFEAFLFNSYRNLEKDVQYSMSDLVLRYVDKLPLVRKEVSSLPSAIESLNTYSQYDSTGTRMLKCNETLSTLGNVDLDALRCRYSSSILQPLLSLLACPVENAISMFLAEKAHVFKFENLPTLDEVSLFEEIAQYVDSPSQGLQENAWKAINYFLTHDIYRCNMMLESLSKTVFAATVDFFEFASAARRQCRPPDDGGDVETIYRHYYESDLLTSDDEDIVQSDCEPVEGEEEVRQFNEPGGRDESRLEAILEKSDSGEPLEPVRAETSGLIYVEEVDPDEGEVEIGRDTESEETDFVSFIEEEDMGSRLSSEVHNDAPEPDNSNDAPVACGGRIDTEERVELAEESIGEMIKLDTSADTGAPCYKWPH